LDFGVTEGPQRQAPVLVTTAHVHVAAAWQSHVPLDGQPVLAQQRPPWVLTTEQSLAFP